MRAQGADEQAKGITKMMVYRNLLIHATLGYEKNRASYIDYINELVVLKADAGLISSVQIPLPENEAFDTKLALEEDRENSGKSLSVPRAFEAHHTKANADYIAKDVRCADLEGRHLELECVRDEAAIGFSRRQGQK